ncbi:helix-turn-helix domain-containing protein [Pseudanabaena sp. ABRG5-3]|uniref:helix-turn-helix domain-containing protein n=1 Tax=Pseudanabaena sp. ABRG5-3 TaxID=685565 RepID=UPI000DC6FAB3|nr:helix-turn-helix domain-containing protein [Pseudanabaena sp. ABRG5-3]BBC27020.1 transcriptional regulator, XRE family [Pseudanabaena sp. ABRG5-3]
MAYKISGDCVACSSCIAVCPTGAISIQQGNYWIDPAICNNCEGYAPEPLCVSACNIGASMPLQPKKGRVKAIENPFTVSPSLFTNGVSTPFSSAIAIWEACNLLAQRQSLPWSLDDSGTLVYERSVSQGKGKIALRLNNIINFSYPRSHLESQTILASNTLDIRSTCLHLLYAAYATTLEKPWEQEFSISDSQIEEYLGLDKRKDLSKSTKLNLIKTLAIQPCWITAQIDWPKQGKVESFSLPESPLWSLLEIVHHFHEDEEGCKHLIGLTFRLKAGDWSQYFLNKKECHAGRAFYQYSHLPKSLLGAIMSIWQQHEGAARMLLWLLFKTRMGDQQRIMVMTLMRVAYGEDRVNQAISQREERKRLLRMFESDLEVVNRYGLKPIFDPVSYPTEIQPLWSKLADIPDDAEAALDFWINDGSCNLRLTDVGPRGKWQMLTNARILSFELLADWEQPAELSRKKRKFERSQNQSTKQRSSSKKVQTANQSLLSGEQIATLRKNLQISQRTLAEKIGKSQSWIRDVENGRFQAKQSEQQLIRQALGL